MYEVFRPAKPGYLRVVPTGGRTWKMQRVTRVDGEGRATHGIPLFPLDAAEEEHLGRQFIASNVDIGALRGACLNSRSCEFQTIEQAVTFAGAYRVKGG